MDSFEKITRESGRVREVNIGKRRAEEWVNSTAAVVVAPVDPTAESHSESGHGGSAGGAASASGRGHGYGFGAGSGTSGVGSKLDAAAASGSDRERNADREVPRGGSSGFTSNVSGESAAQAARRRRAAVHGFTDFQVPEDW